MNIKQEAILMGLYLRIKRYAPYVVGIVGLAYIVAAHADTVTVVTPKPCNYYTATSGLCVELANDGGLDISLLRWSTGTTLTIDGVDYVGAAPVANTWTQAPLYSDSGVVYLTAHISTVRKYFVQGRARYYRHYNTLDYGFVLAP